METIRTEAKSIKYVITAQRGITIKYVGRGYNHKNDYGYTIKLNGAMMFDKPELAERFMEMSGIQGVIRKVEKSMKLREEQSDDSKGVNRAG